MRLKPWWIQFGSILEAMAAAKYNGGCYWQAYLAPIAYTLGAQIVPL